jgi:integrase
VDGNNVRLSLETDVFSVAKQKLGDKIKQIRKPRPTLGTFAQAQEQYETDLDNDHTIGAGTRSYRRDCLKALLKTWPGLPELPVRKISAASCRAWAQRFASKYDEQYFNGTLGTFRRVLELAGLRRDDNPGFQVKRLGVKRKELHLPEPEQFEKILHTIENWGRWQSRHSADLVRFLAFSGCRISEARLVKWSDIDWERGEIRVRNAKRSKQSSGDTIRFVPIIPPMRELLERLQVNYREGKPLRREHEPWRADCVCLMTDCNTPLALACKACGFHLITHHDLRHLFATQCIEAGVDVPTVSRWLGHSDGGALAMRVYGHLRREHSATMAQRVTFTRPAPGQVLHLQLGISGGVA